MPPPPQRSRGRFALVLVPLAAAIVAMAATVALTPGEARRAQAALPRFTLPMSPGVDDEPIASDAESVDDLQDAEPQAEEASADDAQNQARPTKAASHAPERSRFLDRRTPRKTQRSDEKKAEPEITSAPPSEKGTLVAMAIGASCAFAIDGAPMGTSSSVRKKVAPGNHAVSCQKIGGTTRTRSVSVQPGKASVTVFKF